MTNFVFALRFKCNTNIAMPEPRRGGIIIAIRTFHATPKPRRGGIINRESQSTRRLTQRTQRLIVDGICIINAIKNPLVSILTLNTVSLWLSLSKPPMINSTTVDDQLPSAHYLNRGSQHDQIYTRRQFTDQKAQLGARVVGK
jgi:hypothetical protein